MVVSAAWSETLCNRRNSDRCDSKTEENIHMSKLGGRKRKTTHRTVLVAVISGLESSSNQKGPHEAIAVILVAENCCISQKTNSLAITACSSPPLQFGGMFHMRY